MKKVLDLMDVRFICTASYPIKDNCLPVKKGDIITCHDLSKQPFDQWGLPRPMIWDEERGDYLTQFPDVFRRLQWWEHRSIEELATVKYVLIIDKQKPGYYLVGDQVPVVGYEIATEGILTPKLKYFVIGNHSKVEPKDCFPATEKKLL